MPVKCFKAHWYNDHLNKYNDRENICDTCLEKLAGCGVDWEIISLTNDTCEHCGFKPKQRSLNKDEEINQQEAETSAEEKGEATAKESPYR